MAAMTAALGSVASMAMSQKPWCTAPSPPTRPARSSSSRTASPCSDTSWNAWSKARCRKVLYTAKKGFQPLRAMPAIMSMAWLSQMPVSKVRSGNFGMTLLTPVPSGMAAVATTTFGSRVIRSTRASPTAPVKLRALFFSSMRQPSLSMSSGTVNGPGLCVALGSFSVKEKPLPFTVFTCSTMGRSKCLASLRNSSSVGKSWPSIGPTATMPKCSNQASWLTAALLISPMR